MNSNHHELKNRSFGILGAEFYFPKSYVDQSELEQYDGAGCGKYTKGFGQIEMSFCHKNEDVCSIALSATSDLLKNYKIKKHQVGFLAVGTETMVDKSKSVRTVLMSLFENSKDTNTKCNGNSSELYDSDTDSDADIEGADVKNACFGGTQALFHAIDWLHSNWDMEKKYAIVVCADIAVYDKGPARCTGGAGAIAFLLGPNAPFVFEPGLRAFNSRNVYDFYKPVAGSCSEYPVVFGSSSIDEYMNSLQKCYSKFGKKFKRQFGKNTCIDDFHGVLFHSPFTRLAQKAFCSLIFYDYKKGSEKGLIEPRRLEKFISIPNADTPRENAKPFWDNLMGVSKTQMEEKLNHHMEFNRRLGNMYTPSLWAQFLNSIKNNEYSPEELDGKRILLYSYGSGCIAAMFSIRFNFPPTNCSKESPGEIARASYAALKKSVQDAYQRLNMREKCTPAEFEEVLDARERMIRNSEEFTEKQSNSLLKNLFNGAYYLCEIDSSKRRFYAKK